jgi:tetratricopeptide (TPR) repeat protein
MNGAQFRGRPRSDSERRAIRESATLILQRKDPRPFAVRVRQATWCPRLGRAVLVSTLIWAALDSGCSFTSQALAEQNPAPPNANPAPKLVAKVPAKDSDLRALETAASRLSTAKEALALYDHFQATRELPVWQDEKFKVARQTWSVRAQQNLVRLGDKWVAADVANAAHKSAAGLLKEAYEMWPVNPGEAVKTLEQASRLDPNAITSEFTLGALYSITAPRLRNPAVAARHFQAVLRRIPGYVPALNNLALAQIRLEKYPEALRYFREAAERAPASDELRQNLARFLKEANLGRIRPRKTVVSEATKLYAKVTTLIPGDPPDSTYGWRSIPLVIPSWERKTLGGVLVELEMPIFIAQGTGLVVSPHHVLTCRHLLEDLMLGLADHVELLHPANPNGDRHLSATVVAASDDDDLCLLHCDDLKAPAAALAGGLPPRGTELLSLGYPGQGATGLGSSAATVTLAGLPGHVGRIDGARWCDLSRDLWCDATSGRRATASAICDNRANVVAIHSAEYTAPDEPKNKRHLGAVPAPVATAFLQKSLPGFAGARAGGPVLKWNEVEAKINPSIVVVVVGYRRVAMAFQGNAVPRDGVHGYHFGMVDLYDDHVCSACNGRAQMRCRAPGCQSGTIHGDIVADAPLVVGVPNRTRTVLPNQTAVPTQHVCRNCGGTGFVKCPYCKNGIDHTLH